MDWPLELSASQDQTQISTFLLDRFANRAS